MIAIQRAIEVAEHNGMRADDGTLTVWDSSCHPYGTILEVYPAAKVVGGFCATARGIGGTAFCCGSYPTELEAATAALDGFLKIVNNGV